MSVEYKTKNDLPDLYNILGLSIEVCKEQNCNDIIHKAYIKKAIKCHPDKHPGRKDIAEVFELLTSAYEILHDDAQRQAYNHKLSLDKQSSKDFTKLKKSTTEYMESLGEYKPATDQQKLNFKDHMKALDVKHGFDTGQMSAIDSADARKKMNDMNKTRSEQDRILKPERLFDEGMPIDIKKFNAMFDKMHNRNEGAIVSHNGAPSAWDNMGSIANYSSFDNLDNLYVDDSNRADTAKQNYGSVDFGAPMKKITKDDMKDVQGADYVDGHNILGDEYYKNLKTKLRERGTDASNFDSMKYGDFKKDDTAGYGIFEQLGFKFDDRLALDVDEDDISKKYDRLMAERQQLDIKPSQGMQLPPPPKSTKQKSNQNWR